ncbi:unnamed protein product [Ectocarpus sp. CCAP 1310/34]|nr:unnamed protein product [Ectocarpus sp. CCAP 1310/34]
MAIMLVQYGLEVALYFWASQGWRASMEDAHIALLKVPHGQPPTSAAIGAARIGLFNNHSHKPPLRSSGSRGSVITAVGDSNGPSASGAQAARRRAETFSAGDTGGLSQQGRLKDETGSQQTAAISREGPRRGSTGAVKGRTGFAAASDDSGGGGDGSSSVGAGWKAVDLLEDAALFGVFDGHGGKAVADFCKERLPGLLAASPDIRAGNWRDGFPRVYHALDALLKSGEGQEKTGGWGGATKVDGIGVGCTIVTALLDRKRRQCYVAHAGDSRCVLCRAGRAVQLTRDHKPGMPSEYARIMAAGGHVSRAGRVNDNLNLSRAIGDMVYKRNHLRQPKDQIISAEPDVCRFLVTPGVDEFLILACDGVWEMMNTAQGLRAGSAPREVCESLLDACLSPDPKGTRYAGCDNMTVVLVLLDGWEGALATKAYTPALTFSGGRIGSVGEAAAAMSATLPKLPRPLRNARPPLPAEFRAAMSNGTTAPAPKSESESQAAEEAGAANREKPAAPAPETEPPGHGNASQQNATVGATESAGKMGWTQRRIAAGKVAPPRTAHGIEFALASFSAPIVAKAPAAGSRMSTGSINRRGVVTAATGATAAAGDLATSAVAKQRNASRASSSSVPPNARRRNSNHPRSATAPMLPSPLWHHRQRREPPEERTAAAAAIAVLAEVGAAGAVAASALAEETAAPSCQNPSANGKPSGMAEVDSTAEVCGQGKAGEESGRQASPSEDTGLVFVPVEPSATPSEVTVTATASPHHPT